MTVFSTRFLQYLKYSLACPWLEPYRLHRSTWQEHRHDESPRAFAHVVFGKPFIYYCSAFLSQPYENQAGILLHEVGHVVTGKYTELDAEACVDAWVVKKFPESGYHYEPDFVQACSANFLATAVVPRVR